MEVQKADLRKNFLPPFSYCEQFGLVDVYVIFLIAAYPKISIWFLCKEHTLVLF